MIIEALSLKYYFLGNLWIKSTNESNGNYSDN